MIKRTDLTAKMVPIDQITVVNARSRGSSKFKQIVANIGRIGLKKPITLARRNGRGGGPPHYDLVCGQGRLEAYKALGGTEVPAIVIDATKEEVLLMSLIENLARRRHTSVELAKEIAAMKERGHDFNEIARKTDLDVSYVRGIVRLLNKGEERLLQAVEKGSIPISIAITIASSDDQAVQRALAEAYENKTLRGRALLKARRLVENRRLHGKSVRGGGFRPSADGNAADGDGNVNGKGSAASSQAVLRTFHRETARQQVLVRKARVCETRLLFIVSAMKSLFRDENFLNLLRAQSLDTLPQYLAEQLEAGKRS